MEKRTRAKNLTGAKKPNPKATTIHSRVTDETYRKLIRVAYAENRTVSAMIMELVRSGLEARY